VYVAVTLLHPPGVEANDHPVVFREYAMAQTWVLARNPALWIWTAVAGVLMWRRLRLLDATLPTSSRGSDQTPDPAR
jgi:hypothetical protein